MKSSPEVLLGAMPFQPSLRLDVDEGEMANVETKDAMLVPSMYAERIFPSDEPEYVNAI